MTRWPTSTTGPPGAISSRSGSKGRSRTATPSAPGSPSSPAVGPATAWRFGGGSYQSASDPRLHFGLGDATRVDSVEVHWPTSGQTDRFEGLPAGTGYLLREGGGSPSRIPGFPPLAEPLPAK